MNIALIGARNPAKLGEVLHEHFDGINVVNYADISQFMQAMLVRTLDFHRMLLWEEGLNPATVPDEDIYEFQNMILTNFPAMKLITISKDTEFTKFFADLFSGSTFAHFCVPSLKGKMFIDMVSMDTLQLYKKYDNFTYKVKVEAIEETLDSDVVYTDNKPIDNTEIEGYIPPPNKEKKRSFFDIIIGRGPKEPGNLIKEDGLSTIGQVGNTDEFSEGPVQINFNENPFAEEETEEVGYNIFQGDDNVDIGLGYDSSNTEEEDVFGIADKYLDKSSDNDNSDFDFEDNSKGSIFGYEAPKESYNPFEEHKKMEFEPLLNIEKEEEKMEEVEDIDIPSMSLDSLKKVMNESDVRYSDDVFRGQQIDIDIETEDADTTSFDVDMGSLMSDYDDLHKTKEIVVEKEKVVYVNTGGDVGFRNKNGVKIIIVTGDRRIGSTKLALNLANKYAIKEGKVLYVDMDRRRHGSLGYINLDALLEEPEHVQNGVAHLKSLNILKNVCHFYNKGKFFVLTSLYGVYFDDAHFMKVQDVLASQRDFSTIVVDCPLEDLHLMTGLIGFSHILLCAEDDKVGLINLLTTLESSIDSKTLYTFFEKSYFVVGRKGNIDKFNKELVNVVDMFERDEENTCDWTKLKVLGTLKGVDQLAAATAD